MAKTGVIKIADDIEYRVIGSAFGLLIASAGLLAGEMVRLRGFEYWLHDIVPLLLVCWMALRLYRNFLSTILAYQDYIPPASVARDRKFRESIKSDQVAVAQIAAKTGYSEEQVVAEVAKRIEAKKAAEALKKNKQVS